MATRPDEPYAADGPEPYDNALTRAQARLTATLTELSRLKQDPLFDRVDGVIADLVNATASPHLDVDTVHKLRDLSAAYERVAIELEAAARCCRLVDREISQRIDALLAGGAGELTAKGRPNSEAQRALTRRRIGLDGWFVRLFHRGRPGTRRSRESSIPVVREHDYLLPALPMQSLAPYPEPTAAIPVADIAALALGPLEVHVAGQRVPRWTSLKARAVFQYLLIHQDRPTRRDVLMALQWPEHSHNSARNNLNVALYSLRNTLDGPGHAQPILYRDGCYVLNPALSWWIDRNEFLSALDDARQAHRTRRPEKVMDSYHKAIQLYRGPLFEDDGASEWYLPEQRRLRDLYGQALEHVAEIHFQLGELPEALQFGHLAVSNDPCCEAIHRLLMRCYASQHQQQLVSRQYHACVTSLNDELGVPPGEETVQLFHKLTAARRLGS